MIFIGLNSTHDKTLQNNIQSISSSLENNCNQVNAYDVNANVNRNIECVVEYSRQVIII